MTMTRHQNCCRIPLRWRVFKFGILSAWLVLCHAMPSHAQEQDLTTGKGFFELCQEGGQTWEHVRCLDYLGGIFEGLIVGVYVANRPIEDFFCLTRDTSNATRLKEFLMFLKRDTWRMNAPTPNLFYLYMQERYVCPKMPPAQTPK